MTRKAASELSLGPAGLKLIKDFEGFVPYPYDDLVVRGGKYPEWTGGPVKGTITIGYGHTNLSGFPPMIRPGLRMTEPEASDLLRRVLAKVYEPEVRKRVHMPLSQNEYDALVSFTYNVGGGNLAKSTLLRKINAGDYTGAAAEFDKWTSSKGTKLAGLVRRRNAEEALFRNTSIGVGGTIAVGGGVVAQQSGADTSTQIAIGVGIFAVLAVVTILIVRRRK